MTTRVRFAPSPTGQIHIGNIRTAIFNWLTARGEGGEFILRIEDTDRERSTRDAIDKLLDCMEWLKLDVDEEPLYQSARAATHLEAAERLLESGAAYRPEPKDGEPTPVIFQIPMDTDGLSFVREKGPMSVDVHREVPVTVSKAGVGYAGVSKKGKPIPDAGALAGFSRLEIVDGSGETVFRLDDHLDEIVSGGETFSFEGCASLRFVRKEVIFQDLIKGALSKPLDGMKDLVVVRSDGAPVFHLANVVDDAYQKVTRIIRGDDHVENTYRHLFLFHALGMEPPEYAHLPMIVNQQGKPYSKRDGDAFVGEFRDKGVLSDALFNYLVLLGWSPGDDREKMDRDDIVQAFSLNRVKSHPAKFDMNKLLNLNGQYVAEMDSKTFADLAWDEASKQGLLNAVDRARFSRVAELMRTRTKLISQVDSWGHFFADEIEHDRKALRKFLKKDEVKAAVAAVAERLATLDPYDETTIEALIHEIEDAHGIAQGKLNQPLRVAVTGVTVGAGLYETIALLDPEKAVARIRLALERHADETSL